jgi:hypothetical protein
MILIGHDHEVAVSKTIGGGVVLIMLETENLLDVLNLDVFDDLVVTGLSDIEQLSTQGEDTVLVATNDSEAGDCECLGGVSFRQDQSAVLCIAPARIVCVFQLDDARDSGVRDAT